MMLPPSRARTAGLELGQVNQRPAASIQLSTALSSINKNSDEYFNQIGGVGLCVYSIFRLLCMYVCMYVRIYPFLFLSTELERYLINFN